MSLVFYRGSSQAELVLSVATLLLPNPKHMGPDLLLVQDALEEARVLRETHPPLGLTIAVQARQALEVVEVASFKLCSAVPRVATIA